MQTEEPEGTGGWGVSTFDKCFVYEKNLLCGRFVEENTARLLRSGIFWGLAIGKTPLFAHDPTRSLGESAQQCHIGWLGKKGHTGYILVCS